MMKIEVLGEYTDLNKRSVQCREVKAESCLIVNDIYYVTRDLPQHARTSFKPLICPSSAALI